MTTAIGVKEFGKEEDKGQSWFSFSLI